MGGVKTCSLSICRRLFGSRFGHDVLPWRLETGFVSGSGTRWLIMVSMRRVDQLGVRGIARARNWTATWLLRPTTERVVRLC